MSRGLLPALPLATAHYVLDLGSGTGELLPDLQTAAPQAAVIAVDRSEGMLRVARRIRDWPMAVMDAQLPALRHEMFDVAVLAFVLHILADPLASLCAVRCVLRPGGAVGIVTWGESVVSPGREFWKEELDAYGAASDPQASNAQQTVANTSEKLRRLLEAAGLAPMQVWTEHFTHRWTVDGLVALRFSCDLPSERLASLPPDGQTSCRARVEKRLKALTPEELVFRPEVLFAVAHLPGPAPLHRPGVRPHGRAAGAGYPRPALSCGVGP